MHERLAQIRGRIERACARVNRDPASVTLVAVSKRQPIQQLRAAYDLGLRVFGENQVQEALTKSAQLPDDIDWQMIGPLQSNKARPAAELFSTIHSIDRLKIAHKLDAAASESGRVLRVFLQAHIGEEATKHGFPVETFVEEVRPLAKSEHLDIVGLMAIPPYEKNPEDSRPSFRKLRDLRDRLAELPEWSTFPGLLSMGMSHDFEVAIEEGATHIRVGTSLFGPRPT